MQDFDSNEKLLSLAIGGDERALKALLLRIDPVLCGWLARRITPPFCHLLHPEEILQEAYVEVFRGIAKFQPRSADAFGRWVATLAANRLRNAIRHLRATKRGGEFEKVNNFATVEESTIAFFNLLASPEKTPSRIMAASEAIDAVEDGLIGLPERHRIAIRVMYLEGKSAKEAAARIGCTERAVHGLCRRGLRLLESYMQAKFGSMSYPG